MANPKARSAEALAPLPGLRPVAGADRSARASSASASRDLRKRRPRGGRTSALESKRRATGTAGVVAVRRGRGDVGPEPVDARLLTVDELARVLRVGLTTASRLVRIGAIESILIGRLRRVPLVAVEAYIERELAAQRLSA